MRDKPSPFFASIQSFVLFLFLAIASGCGSSNYDVDEQIPDYEGQNALLPNGVYMWESSSVDGKGLVEFTAIAADRIHVEMWSSVRGSFQLEVDADGDVSIEKSRVDYEDIKRSYEGKGKVSTVGHAGGWDLMILKNLGRDTREEKWTVRPATPAEIERYKKRERKRAEYEAKMRQQNP